MLNVLTGKLVAKDRTYLRNYRDNHDPIDGLFSCGASTFRNAARLP